jgi:hypothetical protein
MVVHVQASGLFRKSKFRNPSRQYIEFNSKIYRRYRIIEESRDILCSTLDS